MGPQVRVVAHVRGSKEKQVERGFSLEDLLQELGRLELNALDRVKHGDLPPAREGAS
jgi:hypothetical protein